METFFKAFFLILLCLFSIQVLHTSTQTTKSNNNINTNYFSSIDSFTPTHAISITNNNDFSSQAQLNNWTGSGTKNDPFIIQNYLFNNNTVFNSILPGHGSIGRISTNYVTGLSISNVNYFFVIKHNFFSSFYIINTPDLINIQNSANGILEDNIIVENSTTLANTSAINIETSTNLILRNNTFYMQKNFGINSNNFPVFSGLNLFNDSEVTCFQNTFTNFQVKISIGSNITLTGNMLNNAPLHIITSTTTISYNQIENSYYGVYIDPEGILDLNIPVSLSLTGPLPLRKGSILHNNLFFNNTYGIYLLRANVHSSVFIVCPGFFECSGLPTSFSGYVILHNANNLIRNNEFVNNTNRAIYIDQHDDNNTIYKNDFINNAQSKLNKLNDVYQFTTQVYESEIQNITNKWSSNGVGNYWSDYNYRKDANGSIGSIPMRFSQNNSDLYPLLVPFNNNYLLEGPRDYSVFIIGILASTILVIIIIAFYVKGKKKRIRVGQSKKNNYMTKNGKHQEKLSDETLDLIENIIKENNP